MTTGELMSYIVCDIVFAILAICVPTRLLRHESAVLMHKLELTKHFIRYISHELRTPLNNVLLGTQLVSRNLGELEYELTQTSHLPHLTDLVVSMTSTASSVYSSCQGAVDVLNSLLLFDKLEDGLLRLRPQPHNLVKAMEGWIEPFVSQASEEGINLIFKGNQCFPDGMNNIFIKIDNLKFAQVIRKILSNALKFTPTRGSVTVSAHLLPPEDEFETDVFVRITIRDTGCGIIPENQPNVLKNRVQFSVTEARDGKGTGLGLYVARCIVSKHGGALTLESSGVPGEGCAFHVDLPVCSDVTLSLESPASSYVLNREASSASNVSAIECYTFSPSNQAEVSSIAKFRLESSTEFVRYNTKKRRSIMPLNTVDDVEAEIVRFKRALVVDDVKTCRRMLSRALSPFVNEIIEREDGVGAVEAVTESIEEGRIDIIFMDSVMPNMSGIEACRIIRDMGYTGPIVAVTGNVVEEDVNAFLAAGADKLVGKPMKLDTLVATLQEFNTINDISPNATQDISNCIDTSSTNKSARNEFSNISDSAGADLSEIVV